MCEREATKAIHRGHPTMMSTRCHQVRHGRPQAFTAQLLLLLSAANDYVGGGSRLLQPAPGSESDRRGSAVASPTVPPVVRVCAPMPAYARAAPLADRPG